MEREKIIEELSNLIANNDCGKHHDCSACAEKDYMFCQYQHLAVRLYDCGVKVVTEGAVVLTKKEYEELKQRPEKIHDEMDERMKEELAIEKRMGEKKAEKALKETAKEILAYLWKQRDVIGQLMIIEEDLIELAQQYAVEVEE